MNSSKGLRILTSLFFLNLVMISWFDLKANKTNSLSPIGWPRPSRFLGLGISFSLLAILAETFSAELAAVIGAGLSIGLIMQGVNSAYGSPAIPGSGAGGQIGSIIGQGAGALGNNMAAGAGGQTGAGAGGVQPQRTQPVIPGFPTSSFRV